MTLYPSDTKRLACQRGAGLEKMIQTLPPGVKVIPGHGPLAGKADMERALAMLDDGHGARQA